MKYPSLEIRRLELSAHLGCSAEERATPQSIEVSVKFFFDAEPKGAQSDTLTDTLCYAKACDLIRQVVTQRPYLLIESIAYEVATALETYLKECVRFEVQIHKLNPPIPDLRGGTVYTCHRPSHTK